MNGLAMSEILIVLQKASNRRINFLYFPHVKHNSRPILPNTNIPLHTINPATGQPEQTINPSTGLPWVQHQHPLPPQQGFGNALIGLPVANQQEVNQQPRFRTVTGPLRNLTLKQFLDIVSMSMQPPVQYVVTGVGVIFIPRENTNSPALFTRTYQLNPFRLGIPKLNTTVRQRGTNERHK